TGKWTMFYMAVSLSFTAGGIILLYLLWDVEPVEGETLNAVTFRAILQDAIGNPAIESPTLWLILALEGGLLFVAANTGYLGGPAVLANMAADSWVPHQYRYLSSRLVTQRGIVLMGVAAIGILIATGGSVAVGVRQPYGAARNRAKRGDRGIRGWLESVGWCLCAGLGEARVSWTLSQFRLHERAHGRRQVLQRFRRIGTGAKKSRSNAE